MWNDRFVRNFIPGFRRRKKHNGENVKLDDFNELTFIEGQNENYWTMIKREDSRKVRREKMKLSFRRNGVEMQVTEEDILIENEDGDCDDIADGLLILPRCLMVGQPYFISSPPPVASDSNTFSTTTTTVPNCCIICLDTYKVGQTVVWSSNDQCPHAFHRSCIMKYLDKIHKRVARTPCPCCRRDFTDLEVEKRRKKFTFFGRASRLRRFLNLGS